MVWNVPENMDAVLNGGVSCSTTCGVGIGSLAREQQVGLGDLRQYVQQATNPLVLLEPPEKRKDCRVARKAQGGPGARTLHPRESFRVDPVWDYG